MNSYLKTTKNEPGPETNEIYAFQANCLLSSGKFDELLSFLLKNEK